jgi:predicted glycogen debranching enzyme
MIDLGPNTFADFDAAASREWVETNGIGGYASSTVAGAHTRRYHGLLVAATRPPLGRMVLLSKYEETLVVDGERFELSGNRYPGTVHPEGHRFIKGFRLDPFPVWQYSAGGVTIERTIFMANGENTTVARWTVTDAGCAADISIEVRPLIVYRDHHHLRHDRSGFDESYEVGEDFVSMQPEGEAPRIFLSHNARAVEHTGHWYRDLEYSIEQERGFDFHEDLFQPMMLAFDLTENAIIIASTTKHRAEEATSLERAEIERRAVLIARSQINDRSLWPLVLAADQFLVRRGGGHTVIAGYHWFSDWGRDTMIALPGLTLATGRPEIAKSILSEFSRHISKGMLPNRFPDAGEEPEYNTVDATLWFFEAIRAYAEATGDIDFVKNELYHRLADIIDCHIRGTRYGIRVDDDGLLHAGEAGVQLTWMDAKIGDWVVTPRTGKPVEIQALWYNALCSMACFAKQFEDAEASKKYSAMAAAAKRSFNDKFWNDADGCLFDVVNGGERDGSLRPNQIFAASLHHSMLPAALALKVVNKVENGLLTPVGLRSLGPDDPRYVPAYIGSPNDRDASYHQGTVWPWLIGAFVDAYRKTHSKDARAAKRITEIIDGLRNHLTDTMIGQVSEIFDADPPHSPRGCAAQAWSVAEPLRVAKQA